MIHCNTKKQSGYTLIELVVTVSIISVLAAVVLPTYLKSQAEAKGKVSQANMLNIKQAFVNHFYSSVIERNKGAYPPEPADNKMTHDWANNTILYNGRTPAQLFSEGHIIYNPYNHPYLYELIGSSNPEEAEGFRITDPDIGIVMEFMP